MSLKIHVQLSTIFLVIIWSLSLVCLKWYMLQIEARPRIVSDVRYEDINTTTGTANDLKSSEKRKKPKLVLFYTTLFGRTPWPRMENDYQFNNWNNIPCEVRNCRISYNKNDLNTSDAVIFHGQDIDYIDLPKLGKTVNNRAKQRWIFFMHECPVFFTKNLKTLKNVFNWTMTYKLDSDIFVPYLYYFPRAGKNYTNASSHDYTRGKDRLVAWMVSHCGKQRDKLVKKLMEYIPVHIYGACAPKFSQKRTCIKRDKDCQKTLRRYKFYLAFENANCVDYITEKYWSNSLRNNIVPVVLGGGNYSNRNLAVPGSFINVMDFQTVKELADYLVTLDRNDTAYNEYFTWKDRYYIDFPPSWTCQMCSMLNNASLPIKSYDHQHFEKFWGRTNNCRFLDGKVEKIVKGSSESTVNNRGNRTAQ